MSADPHSQFRILLILSLIFSLLLILLLLILYLLLQFSLSSRGRGFLGRFLLSSQLSPTGQLGAAVGHKLHQVTLLCRMQVPVTKLFTSLYHWIVSPWRHQRSATVFYFYHMLTCRGYTESRSCEINKVLFCKRHFMNIYENMILYNRQSRLTKFTWLHFTDNWGQLKLPFRLIAQSRVILSSISGS